MGPTRSRFLIPVLSQLDLSEVKIKNLENMHEKSHSAHRSAKEDGT